jgi:hypothetical protein
MRLGWWNGRGTAGRGRIMRIALSTLPALLAVFNSACGPAKLLPTPRGWPREVDGRKLHNTPTGLIYATNAASAGWMNRYLQKRLPRIEEQFDVKLPTGVVIVISPGDPPVPEIKGWPPWPVKHMMYVWLPPVTTDDFGLPKGRWVCPQPTDSYYDRAVSDYHCRVLANTFLNPAAVASTLTGGWMFLLLMPRQRELYVRLSDVRRERALATAAIGFCDLPEPEKENTLQRVTEYYRQREKEVNDKYGPQD